MGRWVWGCGWVKLGAWVGEGVDVGGWVWGSISLFVWPILMFLKTLSPYIESYTFYIYYIYVNNIAHRIESYEYESSWSYTLWQNCPIYKILLLLYYLGWFLSNCICRFYLLYSSICKSKNCSLICLLKCNFILLTGHFRSPR